MLNSAPLPSLKNVVLLGPILGIFLFLFIAGLVVFVVGVAFLAFVLWLIVRRFWPEKQGQGQDKPDGGK
jgi:hypothetical protein